MYVWRIRIFFGLAFLAFALLIGKLGVLQIGHGRELRVQYEETLRDFQWPAAVRGSVMDRHDRILAIDRPSRDLCLAYKFLTGDADWIAGEVRRIAKAEGVSREEARRIYGQRSEHTWALARYLAQQRQVDLDAAVARIVRRIRRIREHTGCPIREEKWMHPVVRALDEGTALAIEAELHENRTVGAEIRPSHHRYYPYNDLACHIIGRTGEVSAEEMEAENLTEFDAPWIPRMRWNYQGGDILGKSGIEKLAESILRGVRGYELRKRVDGRYEILESAPAKDGNDVHLTLDIKLQEALTERLRATGRNGALAVLSLPRNEVLALVSVPTYDLNTYARDCEKLFEDDLDFPLIHRAVARGYEPGSTAKPLSALAALAAGKATLHTTHHCAGRLFPGVDMWKCWIHKHGGHGSLNVVDALKHSCNVFFYRAGEAVGPLRLADYYALFGWADAPGTGLLEEKPGKVLPTPEDLRQRRETMGAGVARGAAIGQGYVLVTPLHVANAIAAIARDGLWLPPLLTLEDLGAHPQGRQLPFAPEHLRAVQSGMYKVVNESGGTAYKRFREARLGIEICGKTGTAQTSKQVRRNPQTGQMEVVRDGDMCWFAGYAPAKNPQIAFAIVLEYGDAGGGGEAGPVAIDLIRALMEFGYLR